MNIHRIRQWPTGGVWPFGLRTSDGHEYAAPHLEFIMLGSSRAVLDADREVAFLDPLPNLAIKILPAMRSGIPEH